VSPPDWEQVFVAKRQLLMARFEILLLRRSILNEISKLSAAMDELLSSSYLPILRDGFRLIIIVVFRCKWRYEIQKIDNVNTC
jgi:hypothetical protein